MAIPERHRSTTPALLIRSDPFHRLKVSERDLRSHGSAEGAEMVAVAFIAFAVLVVAWFVAPSRAHIAE